MTRTPYTPIAEGSQATPGLWNAIFSALSTDLDVVLSTTTSTFSSSVTVTGGVTLVGPLSVQSGVVRIAANSNSTDYIFLTDSSNQRSDYIIGSRVGGTGDGLNIWDNSGATMIASFSKQSVRFWQSVIAPIFDLGGQLFNVKSYGAIGDGQADDTAAIRSAIGAAAAVSSITSFNVAGGSVLFPAGTYRVTSTLTVTRNIVLTGDRNAIIRPDSSMTSGTFYVTGQLVSMRGFTIQGRDDSSTATSWSNNTTADGIVLSRYATYIDLRDIRFGFLNGWCITQEAGLASDAQGSTAINMSNLDASSSCKQGIQLINRTQQRSTECRMNAVMMDFMRGGPALVLDGVHDIRIGTSIFYSQNTGNGILITGDVQALVVTTTAVQSSTSTAAISIQSSAGAAPKRNRFAACFFYNSKNAIDCDNGTRIGFSGCEFVDSTNDAVIVRSPSQLLQFDGCHFHNNGSDLATYYDVNFQTTTGQHVVSGCAFESNTSGNINDPNGVTVLDGNIFFTSGGTVVVGTPFLTGVNRGY